MEKVTYCSLAALIMHKNLILEMRFVYYANSVFLPRRTFYKLFKIVEPQILKRIYTVFIFDLLLFIFSSP